MRIAVTTPNGNVGQHLSHALVRAGVRPRLLMRNSGDVSPSLRDHVEVAATDLWDAEQVVTATRDVDVLYWVDPTSTGADPLGDCARATESVVSAVERNQISRVVFQSSVGAEKRHGAGEIDGLAGTEVALDEAGVDVTHLRCGYFFTNLLLQLEAIRAGTLQVVLPLDSPMSWVAPRDIAEVAATLLLNPAWSGRNVQAVHGPADLTWRDVATILTSALGRPVAAERITDEAMRQQLLSAGMPPGLADAVLGMSTGLREGFVPEQPRTVVTTTPTTLNAWLHDELLPVLG